MPIPVLFKNQVQDTIIVFDHTFSGQNFSAQLNFKVDSVIIDPSNWLVCNQNVVTKTKEINTTNSRLKLHPNPAKESVYIHIQNERNVELKSIFVYSMDGRKIEVNYSWHHTEKNALILDISDLALGTYSINIISTENIYNNTFVKH
jgi:hypothetical protein